MKQLEHLGCSVWLSAQSELGYKLSGIILNSLAYLYLPTI